LQDFGLIRNVLSLLTGRSTWEVMTRAGRRALSSEPTALHELAAPDLASALGVFDGLYEPGHLEKLRSEERG
jgi:hypothetical protein